ncbi:hypothetical protein KI688_012558 [Linnemannia hyalina]|uniref:Uncharacterized protein n=1 Tax=Linnemannia hyalina TaxID=64524 RepID=A0A9P7XST5_9FUNG|nr:hypothetical protein KI688_012558 [Linnemannia hyalina]
MDGVDCDWCLVCEKHTAEGETYCSEECRLTDLMSSSASSSSSSSSAGSACFSSPSDSSLSLTTTSSSSLHDNYSMPFVRKQRTSIPNLYAQCTSNPNPPASLMFTTGGNAASALSHHLLLQQQQQQHSKQHQNHNELAPPTSGVHYVSTTQTGANASQYPLFHAALSAFRPASPSGPQQ